MGIFLLKNLVNSIFIFNFAVANEGKGRTLEYSLQPTFIFIYINKLKKVIKSFGQFKNFTYLCSVIKKTNKVKQFRF